MELLFDLLRIKLPSWSSSFLAGRRLTSTSLAPPLANLAYADHFPGAAYGRVANLRSDEVPTTSAPLEENDSQHNLVDHFLTLTLAILFECGLQKVSILRIGILWLSPLITMTSDTPWPAEWESRSFLAP